MSTKTTARSNPFTRFVAFVKAVVAELRKVVWPTRSQLGRYTAIVVAFLVVMVALIGGVDAGVSSLVGLLLT